MCCSCDPETIPPETPPDGKPPKAGMSPKAFMSADGKNCEVRLPAQNCNGKEKVLWYGVISEKRPTSPVTLYKSLVIKAWNGETTVDKTVYCVEKKLR